MKDRAFDTDAYMPEPACRVRIGKQVARQQRMKVENGVAIEADLLCRADQKLDRVLVVKDHLRLESFLTFRFLANIEQTRGIEQRIGVALKAA